MPDLTSTLHHVYHGLLDRALGVPRSSTLNADVDAAGAKRPLGRDLLTAILAMKAEAFDTERGRVDYAGLRGSECYADYRRCSAALREFDPSARASRGERLAFWINLYNALVIDAVIAFGIKESVREDRGFFRRAAYTIGRRRYSADDIEHGILRGNRRHFHPAILLPQFAPDDPRLRHAIEPVDPRIHCALVCASRSCPPIAAYEAEKIDEQLDLAATTFVNGGGVRSEDDGRLCLSPIFRWYGRDFGGREGARRFVLRYLSPGPVRRRVEDDQAGRGIGFYAYDWSLNRL